MHKLKPRVLSGVVATLVACALAGCGGASAPAPAKAATPAASGAKAASTSASVSPSPHASALRKVTLRLGWLVAGSDAPFVLAKDKGWYKQAGFNVAIKQGKGAATTVETVANGSDTFGTTDAATAAQFVSKGAPVKVLADFIQTTPHGFIHTKNVHLKSAADLKGKTIISIPGSGVLADLPAVLRKNHLSKKDVTIDLVSPSAEAASLKSHPGALLLGVYFSTYIHVLKIMPHAVFTSFSKFGVNELNKALITNDKEIATDPNGVRRFVAATIKGWNYSVTHQRAAVADTLKAFPNASKAGLTAGLEYAMRLARVRSPAAAGKPTGWMAASDWRKMLSLLHAYGGMKTVKPLSDYYTNAYLPGS